MRLAQLVGKGEVLVEFEFSIVTEMDSLAAMTISPALRSLLIDDQHRVDQLDVRMTQGSWDFRNPMPRWLDVPPPGLEMAVNFHDGINDTEIAFQALLNKLSVVMGMSMSSVYPHGVLGSPKIGWFNGRPVFRWVAVDFTLCCLICMPLELCRSSCLELEYRITQKYALKNFY